MNLFLYLLASIWFGLTGEAQNCVITQGQAYQRATIPGNMPRKDLDESGKEIESPIRKMNTFFIYVETKIKCPLNVTRLWIDGKAYHTIQEAIEQTPIVVHSSQPGGKLDTLVRKTKNSVYRIHPREQLTVTATKNIAARLERAKIVVEFGNPSHPGYYEIKEVKRIAPMVLQ